MQSNFYLDQNSCPYQGILDRAKNPSGQNKNRVQRSESLTYLHFSTLEVFEKKLSSVTSKKIGKISHFTFVIFTSEVKRNEIIQTSAVNYGSRKVLEFSTSPLQRRAIWKCMEDLLFRTIFPQDYAFQFSPTPYLFECS